MLASAALPKAVLATEDETSLLASRLAVVIGVHDWSSLGDLQSVDGGSFQATGVNFAAAWHQRVTDLQRGTLLLGGEIGFFTNDSNIRGLTADLISRGVYAMPSLKLALGSQRNFYVDAGAGLYIVDFAELDCTEFCVEMDELWEETQFGGYLGISADFRISHRWAVALEAKVHFVSFGTASGLGPESQNLDGPIYTFHLGASF